MTFRKEPLGPASVPVAGTHSSPSGSTTEGNMAGHEEDLAKAARWLTTARKAIGLTGAGISTESGIPDFRSAGGLWSRYNPAEYATLGAFMRDPEKVWRMLAELEEVLQAQPNPGHTALAELEQGGYLAGIVTQNVDGLHQAGGSRNVIEFHGSGRTLSCLTCGAVYPNSEIDRRQRPPRCRGEFRGAPCEAILKPDVVFFDEQIPPQALLDTERLVRDADLILVVGTSCEVWPAAGIPHQVKQQGGRIVEVNLEPAQELPSDLVFADKSATVLPALAERVRVLRQ